MKKIMIVAAVFAAFAMTSCNKCTKCTVSGTTNGEKYEKVFNGKEGDTQMSADDCKDLKEKAEQAAKLINDAAALIGSKDKVSVRCN